MLLDLSPTKLCSSLSPPLYVFKSNRCIGIGMLYEDDNLFVYYKFLPFIFGQRELVYLLLYSCKMYITIGASVVTFNFCILWCNIRGPGYGEGFGLMH